MEGGTERRDRPAIARARFDVRFIFLYTECTGAIYLWVTEKKVDYMISGKYSIRFWFAASLSYTSINVIIYKVDNLMIIVLKKFKKVTGTSLLARLVAGVDDFNILPGSIASSTYFT